MLVNHELYKWVSSIIDLPFLHQYFQANFRNTLKQCRKKYSKRRVIVITYNLKRKSNKTLVLKYNRIKIHGGFGRGRRRPLKKVWNFYGQLILHRQPQNRVQKVAKIKPNRTKRKDEKRKEEKPKEEKPKVEKAKVKSPPPIERDEPANDNSDGYEFVYYQSSDEETADIGIINSSDISPPVVTTANEPIVAEISSSNDISPATDDVEIGEVRSNSNPAGDASGKGANDVASVEADSSNTVDRNGGIETNDISTCTQYSNESTMEASDVCDRLRQQLELLKKGKKDGSRLTPGISERLSISRRTSINNLSTSSRPVNVTDDENSKSKELSPPVTQNKVIAKQLPPPPSARTMQCSSTANRSVGFIDTLINKLYSTGTAVSVDERLRALRQRRMSVVPTESSHLNKSKERPRSAPKKGPNTNKTSNDTTARSKSFIARRNSCSSPEFYGFDSMKVNDAPGLLPTPRVQKPTDKQSVFVSEELDTFMKENDLDNVATVSIPEARQTYDEALLTENAEPPAMQVPHRPDSMSRPRTLAEKRILYEKRKDFKFLMIENESSVYHELKKREKDGRNFDNSLLKGMLDGNSPFTRDCWRATCWLNTDLNRFFFQTIQYGDQEIKVFSGRGNNKFKLLYALNTDDKHKKDAKFKIRKLKSIRCTRLCRAMDKIKINNIDEYCRNLNRKIKTDPEIVEPNIEPMRKLNMITNVSRPYVKPGPLCSKIAAKRTSVDVEYGPYQSYEMPTVQLEVWPRLEQPLPEQIQPYLKLILPHDHITDQWAKFAVCAVKTQTRKRNSRKFKRPEDEDLGSFIFDIPYENNQKKMLVRRRRMHNHWEPLPLDDNYAYRFSKDLDHTDTVAIECADVLSQMITSVAITANENQFIDQDPDIDYIGKIVPIGNYMKLKSRARPKVSPGNEGSKSTQQNKVMKELKRLNATFIDTKATAPKGMSHIEKNNDTNEEECRNTFCRMGCLCESINTENIVSGHCQELNCMFECRCINRSQATCAPLLTPHGNINQLRAEATARLAKEEKDFTSTVVLSENDMFVLPNINGLGKRNKKKPKRFNECLLMDGSMDFVDLSEETLHEENIKIVKYDKASELERMRHANVFLPKLKVLNILEPLCMVHQLYRCFCKNQATNGRPFSLNESEQIVADHLNYSEPEPIMAKNGNQWDSIPSRKRQYTFDRNDVDVVKRARMSFAGSIKPAPVVAPAVAPQSRLLAHDDVRLSARTRPYTGRKLVSKAGWWVMRKNFNRAEAPLRAQLLAIQEKCRATIRPVRPLPKFIDLNDDEDAPSGSADGVQERARTPPIESVPVVNPIDERHVRKLNEIVTLTMRSIKNQQLDPTFDLNSINQRSLRCKSWEHVVAAYNTHKIFVWAVRFEANHIVLAVTTTNEMPAFRNASSVANIKVADDSYLPLVAKMLKKGIMNDQTKQLAVLLYGIPNTWRIVGVIHSGRDYLHSGYTVSPTPETHPILSNKIQNLFELLTQRTAARQNAKRLAEIEQADMDLQSFASSDENSLSSDVASGQSPSARMDLSQNVSIANGKAARATADTVAKADRSDSTDDKVQNGRKNSKVKLLIQRKITNIPINVDVSKNMNIPQLPIPNLSGQLWLMLQIAEDFTHIWFPGRKKFLSAKLIQLSLNVAAEKGKTVLITQFSFHPQVYATPVEHNKIFIGPYARKTDMNLALFRRVEGKMMLLENFEKQEKTKLTDRSTGCWIHYMTNAAEATEETQPKTTNVLTGVSNNNQDELIELVIDPVGKIPSPHQVAPVPPPSAEPVPVSLASSTAPTPTIPVNSQPLANRAVVKDPVTVPVPVFNSPHNPIRIQNVFSIRPAADKLRPTNLSSNTINEILNNSQLNRDHTLATVTPIRPPIDNSQNRLTFPMLPANQPMQTIPIIAPNQIFISPQNMIRMNELKSNKQSMATLIQKPAQIPIGIARPQTVRNILPKPSPPNSTVSPQPNRVFIQTTNARLISAAKPSSQSKFNPTMATIQPIKNATVTISSASATTTTPTSTTKTTATNIVPSSNGIGNSRIVLVRNHDGKVIYKRNNMSPARNVVITNNKLVTSPVRISTSAASNPHIATILNKGAINSIQKPVKGVQETGPIIANIESVNKRPVPQMLKIVEQKRPIMKTYAPASSATATSSHKVTTVSTSNTLSNIGPIKPKVTTAVTAGIEKTKIPIGLTVRALPKETKPSSVAVVNMRQATEPIEIIDLSDDDDDVPNKPSSLNKSESAIQSIKPAKLNDSHTANNAARRKSMNAATTSNSAISGNSANSANSADAAGISKTKEEAPKAKPSHTITSGFLICDNLALGKLLSRKLDDLYIVVQIPGLKSSCKFPMKIKDDLTPVNNYLDKYMRQRVFAFYPETMKIKWHFVSNTNNKHKIFRTQAENTLNGWNAILDNKIIDLRSRADMKRELITDDDVAIGLLRLAYACMTKTDAREANPKTIIKKAEEYINSAVKAKGDEIHVQILLVLKNRLIEKRPELSIDDVTQSIRLSTGFLEARSDTSNAPAKPVERKVLLSKLPIKRAADTPLETTPNKLGKSDMLLRKRPRTDKEDPLKVDTVERKSLNIEKPQMDLLRNAKIIRAKDRLNSDESAKKQSINGNGSIDADVITIDD